MIHRCANTVKVTPIVKGEKDQKAWSRTAWPSRDTDISDSSSQSSTGSTESGNGSVLVTESGELCLVIGDAIKNLLKLSHLIQKSSRRAKFSRSSNEDPCDPEPDILHIRQTFPSVCARTTLLERLGKANAQRRQWFSYRRQHRTKLASALPDPEEDVKERAVSLRHGQPNDEVASASSPVLSASGFDLASNLDELTTATSHYDEFSEPSEIRSNGDSIRSETIYSEGPAFDRNTEILLPEPPLNYSEAPVECPFCFRIVLVEDQKSWQ